MLATLVAAPLAAGLVLTAPADAQRAGCDTCARPSPAPRAVAPPRRPAEAAWERARAEMLRAQRELRDRMARVRVIDRDQPDGWLGVTLSGSWSTDTANGRELWKFRRYPVVELVEPDSPADRAGIEAGYRLIALNGHDVREGVQPLEELLRPGTRLQVRVRRGDETKNVSVLVARRPRNFTIRFPPGDVEMELPDMDVAVVAPAPPAPPAASVPMPPMPPMAALAPLPPFSCFSSEQAAIAGAELRRVGDLRDYFDVDDGLLVLRIAPRTPADRAGLRDGDVIVRAGGRAVTSLVTLQRVLERSDRRAVQLAVVRKGKRIPVSLEW